MWFYAKKQKENAPAAHMNTFIFSDYTRDEPIKNKFPQMYYQPEKPARWWFMMVERTFYLYSKINIFFFINSLAPEKHKKILIQLFCLSFPYKNEIEAQLQILSV